MGHRPFSQVKAERIRIARETAARNRIRDAGEDPDKVLEAWAEVAAARDLDPLERVFWDELDAWLREDR